jgi:hypothetical protein
MRDGLGFAGLELVELPVDFRELLPVGSLGEHAAGGCRHGFQGADVKGVLARRPGIADGHRVDDDAFVPGDLRRFGR